MTRRSSDGSDYLFDPECQTLAAHFLSDERKFNTEHNQRLLAQAIQRAVEDWFDHELDRGP